MNIDFVTKLFERMDDIDPPGCCGTYLAHPNPLLRNKRSVEIGFILEHRFAFHYWLKCKRELMTIGPSHQHPTDKEFRPPDLITWDWHDDIGGECDYDKMELVELNQADEKEVAFFCWAGLRSINDGHIAPALWLNALGNVYVLQKQHDVEECENESRIIKDRYGREHNIQYFRSAKNLAESFKRTNSQTGIIWDVDLDFFTEEEEVPDQCYTPPVSKKTICSLLNPNKLWMQQILADLKAITIAIEPNYTGGLVQSLELFKTWEEALFMNSVFSKECCWRDDLLR